MDEIPQLLRDGHRGVLVTLKRDGRPQLSNVMYAYDEATRTIRVSITDDRAKTRNLRRDPRASFYVNAPDFGSYVVAEATAELTPVTTRTDDPTAEELVALYRAISGEHPDWDEYRAAMVEQRRLVGRLHVERAYGVY
ncbi:F420-dependent oxidoreductase [Wenjunlia vitaminophila]|uniref:F420-dependent oxidoreductase n=1 Tax=Wenjunlia vitaminophila TaxID=76728 RepID=A0A0T6LMM0_WENVI|nr:PPOX class F420-dependent oxidoreductase [Wenjunlia vitaminophila]KRV47100.1 F420-dependent oxidoreductase [Wenjunlia vitaminophila]